jgi:negative regulator of flagellin synthesis FlgM
MSIQSVSGKANNTILPTKSKPDNAVKNNDLQSNKRSSDSVDITALAKEITKAFESSKTTPAINEDRVKAVKKALENGDYPINAEHIAEKMIQMEHEQFNNSR